MNQNLITRKMKLPIGAKKNQPILFMKNFLPIRKIFLQLFLSAIVCVNLGLTPACRKPPTDMRALAPGDALIYLEVKDLGMTLQALTENKAWENLAKEKTGFSQLKNIQAAIVVTDFKTSEKQVTGESSVLNFKPQFAAIADTHQWESTAASIAENQIGKFVRGNYGDDAKLEKSAKGEAKFFAWTSADGRKFFAAVAGSVIYAGNDESLLDKCLAVKGGAAESLLKNEKLAQARETASADDQIAFGYVSSEGIAQLANFVGISTAIEASEEDLPRALIAKILPEIVQKTAQEIVWTAQKNEQGMTDKISVKIDAETAAVFKETLQAKMPNQIPAAEYLPLQFDSITRYDLQNPQIAWRSILLAASKQTDPANAQLLLQFSGVFFENYGIADNEMFLSAIDSPVMTARFDDEGEKSVVIAVVKDAEKLRQSITREINFKSAPEKIGDADVWKSADDDLAAALTGNLLILGEKQIVIDCLNAKIVGDNFAKTVQFQSSTQSPAAAVSVTKDTETAQRVVKLLGNLKEENKEYAGFYTTQTTFAGGVIERRTISDFGLLGTILEKTGDK